MVQENITVEWAEQRDPLPNENRQLVDHQPVNLPGPEKALDGHAPVEIRVFYTACRKLRHYRIGLAC
ncbi:MAG: hypothetical protein ACYC3F_03810 [Gemmatimonadaceae bacterium]